MKGTYDHKEIENKWRNNWEEQELYRTPDEVPGRENEYLLVEFPYPSGAGLHTGHVRSYTALDVVARKHRAEGKNVLYPMGWDAFGLPTENYAIKTGRNPREVTKENTDTFRRQLKMLGFSFDWAREVDTTDPAYFKWTQWIFLQLYKKGLAYKAKTNINWCPKCKIGLANEEVVDGTCERCGSAVEKREKEQWMLAITKYAQRLYDDLDTVEYIDRAKVQQRNWIGPSEGSLLRFPVRRVSENGEQTDRPKKVLLLHGTGGTAKDNWFPWLQAELEKLGATVYAQSLPQSDSPDFELWLAAAREHGDADVIVGHSLGAVLAQHLVAQARTKVKKLVLVAPPHRDMDWSPAAKVFSHDLIETLKRFMAVPIDHDKLAENVDAVSLYYSDNDPFVRVDDFERYPQTYARTMLRGKGHINASAGCTTLPELLDELRPLLVGAGREAAATGAPGDTPEHYIEVFTTRADTLFGATYLVLAPEHPLVALLKQGAENESEIDAYVAAARTKSDIDRTGEGKEKTGVELMGVQAINPGTKEEIPIWIADYVLGSYGTGAIMAVPAHDERDCEFAQKYRLPVRRVVDRKKYLIFDFDGVIGDTYEACLKAKVAMGFSPDLEAALQEMIEYASKKPNHARTALPDQASLDRILAWTKSFGAAMQEQKFALFSEFIHEVERIENAKIAIVSSGSELYVRPAMAGTTLSVSHVLAFEDHHSKEEKIEQIAKDWCVDVRDVYYFTDTLADVYELEHTLDRAKIIGCAWGYLGKDRLEEALPRAQVLENFTDIHRVFESLSTAPGILINSGEWNGMTSEEAKRRLPERVGGTRTTQYRLRDWVFSRQRYWGEPIPMVHCEKDGWVPVPESELPVTLPEVKRYEPTDTGESPLANIRDWVETTCPACAGPARRETDVMPNWAGSSWYYLRYTDPHNDQVLADPEKLKLWSPVTWYNGGMEHTVLHLLYSRFWHKFLYDLGVVPSPEPYAKRTSHGLILAEGGEKMSKSKGNVVNPDEIVLRFGADALRVYEMFMGPFDQPIAWSEDGLVGAKRFLERVWKLRMRVSGDAASTHDHADALLLNQTVKKVGEDIETMKFNTAISQLMVLVNALEKQETIPSSVYETLVRLLAPFAPYLTEELWSEFGHATSVHLEPWPVHDEGMLASAEVTIAVQVNGKTRATFAAPPDLAEGEAVARAKALPMVAKWLLGRKVKKELYIPGRMVSIVIEGEARGDA